MTHYVRLNNCGDPVVRQAANMMSDLRARRNVADYDLQAAFAQARAAKALSEAEDAIHILDNLTLIQRTQITDAMKRYEQGIGDVTWQP